jgi:hypothetical protein
MQMYPAQMRARQFVPPLFAAAVIVSLVMAILVPWGWVCLAAIAGSYGLANLTASVMTAAKKGWQHITFLPVVYAILHLSYGFGFLVGLLRFSDRWRDRNGKVPRFDVEQPGWPGPRTGRTGLQSACREQSTSERSRRYSAGE